MMAGELAIQPIVRLPSLIDRARSSLDLARTSAEILEAKEIASFAYDLAKRSARIDRAKRAHDDLIRASYRLQADALEIESRAKHRLADEYDAAQERGEVAKNGGDRKTRIPDWNTDPATAAEVGIPPKAIFEARQIRDAEVAAPGIVRETLDSLIESGQEPTRAALTQAIVNRTSFTGNNQWFTPEEYVEMARQVLGDIDLDPASHPIAQERVKAAQFFTEDEDGLSREWNGRIWLNPPYSQPDIGYFVDKMVAEYESGRVRRAIVLTHNYTDTSWFQKLARAARAICFTRGRIRFVSPSGEFAAPTQGQAFFYFGFDPQLFTDIFARIGFVVEVCR